MTFVLNRDGGAEVLQEIVADHIRELALQVGAAADDGAKASEYSQIDERVATFFKGKRFIASVSVPAYRQAKDGVLTRAAAAAGLEVRLWSAKAAKK